MTARTRAAATACGAAVLRWLETLEPRQRLRAAFPFDDDERFVWDFVPGPRRGLALADMTNAQREAALGVLDASLSHRGAAEVRAVIALEPILGRLEAQAGMTGTNRDPELYWFAVFGDPAAESPWSWRVGGHHVAIHSTIADGKVVGSAPSFLGANPATVPSGPSAGRRAIDGEETLARAFVRALSPAQRRIAIVDPLAPPDIVSGTGRRADLRDVPSGIRYDGLEEDQRDDLERLIRHYLDRSNPAVAAAEWERIRAADLASVTFAWAGSDQPGQGHYYAIRGPSLLIEYDNTQDGANHIHSVWRDLDNDWGEDLLAAHYVVGHRPA
jgi:plasmid stabilization system protein ParE